MALSLGWGGCASITYAWVSWMVSWCIRISLLFLNAPMWWSYKAAKRKSRSSFGIYKEVSSRVNTPPLPSPPPTLIRLSWALLLPKSRVNPLRAWDPPTPYIPNYTRWLLSIWSSLMVRFKEWRALPVHVESLFCPWLGLNGPSLIHGYIQPLFQ